MSDFEKCINAANKAAGRELSDEELDFVFTEVKKKADYLKAIGIADTLEDAALKAADDLANNIEMAEIIQKRNAALNLAKRIRHIEWSKQNYKTKIVEPIETLLVGTNRAVAGARDGVAQTQTAVLRNYLSGMTYDLAEQDLMPILSSGTMDREVTRALWALGRDGEQSMLAGLPKESVAIAKIINKWEEVARVDANKEGAWIRKAAGYVVKQTHDMYKVSHAGFDKWRSDVLPLFDLKRMLADNPQSNMNELLRNLYADFASGNHMKALKEDDVVAGSYATSNLAKRLSQSREVYFKDADAWFDYNLKYGAGSLRESVLAGLRSRAEATGLMRVLGTNPEDMLKRIESDLVESAKIADDTASLKQLNDKRNALDNYLKAVDGTMSNPVNATAARVSANIRSLQSMAKLGGMLLSQLNDIGIYAMAMRYHGRSFLGSFSEAVVGLGRNLGSKERLDLLSSLDVVLESMTGEIARIGTLSEGGSMTNQMQSFMKYNASHWWTNRIRSSAAMGLSHNLALNKDLKFTGLNKDLQRVFTTYGIDNNRWEILRRMPQKLADGRDYMTADQVQLLPDAMFEKLLKGEGREVNANSVANAKLDLENKLRNYIVDNTSFAALEPDAKTRAIILLGTRPGTVTGELVRFMAQFKSFTGAYMQKAIGRELYGRGYMGDSSFKALAAGNGEMSGLASLVMVTTAMGYVSMVVKDLVKGRTPRDISDPETAWKVFLAAMVQGGGAGIYGDFLFGDASRTGAGTLDTIAGPTIGSAASIIDLYKRALHGNETKLGAEVFRQIINNTPFVNLFYTRMILDYLILYRIQEHLNPGYLRRMEQRIERENQQQFLVRPSEVAK